MDNPDEFHLNAITGDGKGAYFIAGEGGVMFRSLDSGEPGKRWSHSMTAAGLGSLQRTTTCLLVFGLRGNLYRSSDFGDSWDQSPATTRSPWQAAAQRHDGEIVLVGGVGTVLRSRDGG